MPSPITCVVYELRGPRDLALRSESIDPAALGPNDIVARTRCSVISPGTETAAYRGDPPLRPGKTYPRLVGYCNLAQVLAVGAEVRTLGIGDLVLTHQSHRSAFRCASTDVLTRVPVDVPPALAATTYLFHLGYDALLRGAFKAGQTVGVVGLGVLGLGTVALARHLGADVIAFTNQKEAEFLARGWGARVSRKDDPALTPRGVDLLITTSGSWNDWRLALSQTRKDGTIAVLGFPGRTEGPPPFNPLDSQYFHDSQLRILACGLTPAAEVRPNCAFLLNLIRTGKLPAAEILGETAPWKTLGSLYERMSRRDSLKTAALDWSVDAP